MRPNLPNSITIFRILLIPVFMAFLLGNVPFADNARSAQELGAVLAVIVFAVAAASDSLDGYFARRRRQVTVLGALLDPLADKLLVSAALLALVEMQKLSAWVAMVIIAREFAVSGLRMVAAAENVIIPASRWGKAKTVSQMAAIVGVILEPGWRVGGYGVSSYLLGLAVVLTVGSGVDYFVKARERLHLPGSGGDQSETTEATDVTEDTTPRRPVRPRRPELRIETSSDRRSEQGPSPGLERLFVAVPLPPAVLERVQSEQAKLSTLGIDGLRLMRPEQLHVTLAFIGEVDASRREAARLVVEGLAGEVGGLTFLGGVLPLPSPRRARVIALEIDDPEHVFTRLHDAVMVGLEANGLTRRETRPFRPHLTIARLNPPTSVQPRSECVRAAYPVESVQLYRSELGHDGARYTVLASKATRTTGTMRA